MELKEAILKRRSVRKYLPKQVSDEDLNEIFEIAIWAPSATNNQPWYFVVVKSEERLLRVKELIKESFDRKEETIRSRFKKNPEVLNETKGFLHTMGGAPVCILAFLIRDDYEELFGSEIPMIQSVGAAMENICLTAYEKGLGTCWITSVLSVEKELCEEFAPGKGRLIAALTMGYPESVPQKGPVRKPGRIEIV